MERCHVDDVRERAAGALKNLGEARERLGELRADVIDSAVFANSDDARKVKDVPGPHNRRKPIVGVFMLETYRYYVLARSVIVSTSVVGLRSSAPTSTYVSELSRSSDLSFTTIR